MIVVRNSSSIAFFSLPSEYSKGPTLAYGENKIFSIFSKLSYLLRQTKIVPIKLCHHMILRVQPSSFQLHNWGHAKGAVLVLIYCVFLQTKFFTFYCHHRRLCACRKKIVKWLNYSIATCVLMSKITRKPQKDCTLNSSARIFFRKKTRSNAIWRFFFNSIIFQI